MLAFLLSLFSVASLICSFSDNSIIRKLIMRGADPYLPMKSGKSVVDMARDRDNQPLVEYIECVIKDKSRAETAALEELFTAAQEGKIDDMSMFLRNISRPSRLHLVNGRYLTL